MADKEVNHLIKIKIGVVYCPLTKQLSDLCTACDNQSCMDHYTAREESLGKKWSL